MGSSFRPARHPLHIQRLVIPPSLKNVQKMTPYKGSNMPSVHHGKPRAKCTGYRTRPMPRATDLPSRDCACSHLLSVIQELMVPRVCCLNRLHFLVLWLLSGVAMMIALLRGEQKVKPNPSDCRLVACLSREGGSGSCLNEDPKLLMPCLPLSRHAPGCSPLSLSLPPSHLASHRVL